jgi:5-methylcytosine-specific restriction protein B
MSVPENLMILATMNPFDRGVDEVDAAFERRFAKVRMEPKLEQVRVRIETIRAFGVPRV